MRPASAAELQRLADAPGSKWATPRPAPDATDAMWNEAGARQALLAQCRRAVAFCHVEIAEARLKAANVEEVAVTLKDGRINVAGALHWLAENGVADLVLGVDT